MFRVVVSFGAGKFTSQEFANFKLASECASLVNSKEVTVEVWNGKRDCDDKRVWEVYTQYR